MSSARYWSPAASGPLLARDPVHALEWRDAAACAEVGGDEFFPEKGGSTRLAKAVCRSCLVRAECLEYALANDERFGIWGGLSERERRRVARSRAMGLAA